MVEQSGSHHTDQEMSAERTRSDHFGRAIIHVFDGKGVRMLGVGRSNADDPVWLVEHQLDRVRAAEFTPCLFVQSDHAFGSYRHTRFFARIARMRSAMEFRPKSDRFDVLCVRQNFTSVFSIRNCIADATMCQEVVNQRLCGGRRIVVPVMGLGNQRGNR